LDRPFDLVVVGGGIVGAGVARAAAQCDLSVLLVEQSDFSAGTSSRSSKFVHGGLRYLKNGAVHLTNESVIAREQLLAQGKGLVTPIRFLMAHYDGVPPGLGLTKAVLTAYDMIGRRRTHVRHSLHEVNGLFPGLAATGLTGRSDQLCQGDRGPPVGDAGGRRQDPRPNQRSGGRSAGHHGRQRHRRLG
jgi:glycerol-3-phosphate dehydrogenase